MAPFGSDCLQPMRCAEPRRVRVGTHRRTHDLGHHGPGFTGHRPAFRARHFPAALGDPWRVAGARHPERRRHPPAQQPFGLGRSALHGHLGLRLWRTDRAGPIGAGLGGGTRMPGGPRPALAGGGHSAASASDGAARAGTGHRASGAVVETGVGGMAKSCGNSAAHPHGCGICSRGPGGSGLALAC
jgi:hypothetical protein